MLKLEQVNAAYGQSQVLFDVNLEVRDAEALDLVLALNTGVPGAGTVHANSAAEALEKLALLPLLAGRNIDRAFIAPAIASSCWWVVAAESSASVAARARSPAYQAPSQPAPSQPVPSQPAYTADTHPRTSYASSTGASTAGPSTAAADIDESDPIAKALANLRMHQSRKSPAPNSRPKRKRPPGTRLGARRPANSASAISRAAGPLTRTTPTPACPGAVATAAMVSDRPEREEMRVMVPG